MTLPLAPDKIQNLSVLRHNSKKNYLAIAFNKLEKKPSLKNIPVVTLDEIKDQLQKSDSKKVLTFQVDKIDQKPKQYRVKLIQLEKMQVPLFHLKNLHAKEAKLKILKFNTLETAAVNDKNFITEQCHELKITNPGILSQLIPLKLMNQRINQLKRGLTRKLK
ncbi:MAG: hypothetical protein MZV63_45120 [Marinilabiliales bacterium]|nr:hypothetical protein [Marinilabiliales bacterium]